MITIRELAEYRLKEAGISYDHNAMSGADFEAAGLAIMGGCAGCGATLAAYNAYPTKSGYWCCLTCSCGDGWETVEAANADIFEEVTA